MNDFCPSQTPQLEQIYDVKEIMAQLEEVQVRNAQLEELIEEFAQHDGWRCRFYQKCHCGLDESLAKLGLPGIAIR